ncbi:MAG: hypothetical protein K8I60_05280 [Anaerolineae bacterium]|nr:hypothetical protein [Anaerolineae bacterium]
MVRYAELEETYRQILEANPAYFLVDGTNMIYDFDVLHHDKLIAMIRTYTDRLIVRHIVVVIPEGHDMLEGVQGFYTSLGLWHKVHVVPNRDAGIALIHSLVGEEE